MSTIPYTVTLDWACAAPAKAPAAAIASSDFVHYLNLHKLRNA